VIAGIAYRGGHALIYSRESASERSQRYARLEVALALASAPELYLYEPFRFSI
jgi:hypothetical protein